MTRATAPGTATDPRLSALRRFALSITAFTIAGHLWLGFEQSYLTPVAGVLSAYAVNLALEWLDCRLRGVPVRYAGGPGALVTFLLPAHISGLACAMLLYGNESVMPTVFASTVAVAGKYVLRIPAGRGYRHLLNPSNLGIAVTLLCFRWVAIAPPYQFTENVSGPLDWLIPLAVLASGLLINLKLTRRGPLIAGWLGGFALQAVLRAAFVGDALVPALLPATGFAFILFTTYMITDPATSPTRRPAQVAFGAATGLTYGALVLAHVTFGLFYALVLVCLARGLVALVAALAARAHGSTSRYRVVSADPLSGLVVATTPAPQPHRRGPAEAVPVR